MSEANRTEIVNALRSIPIFRGVVDVELEQLVEACRIRTLEVGTTLFHQGDEAQKFYILAYGEVTLSSEGREVFRLSPVQLIGELGALTGIRRNTTAVVSQTATILSLDGSPLKELLDTRSDLGLPVYRNLVELLTTKLMRDKDQTEEIRHNLIHTQRELKRARDMILEFPETPLSEPLYNVLEDLVSKNRRANRRVKPTAQLPAYVTLGDKRFPVLNMSVKGVALETNGHRELPGVGERISGVLFAAGIEMPLSGDVARRESGVLAVTLDLMIDEYEAQLTEYLVRLQMLSFVV
ncbi:MAG: cyclic nucleotide-binding domain-containing protein [Myxococcales bacterium]|nr:cyclic nucleotide-binding domain-containing protein [Myxococcales bacterium]